MPKQLWIEVFYFIDNRYGRSKDLDLSLSVRFANIPSGAKLMLIEKTADKAQENVTIALQTEEFGRLVRMFPTKTSLWSILETLELENKLNLTRRSGIPNENNGIWKSIRNIGKTQVYLMPICLFMNTEVEIGIMTNP